MRHQLSSLAVESYLALWFIDFNLICLQDDKRWSKEQILEMSRMVLSEYGHLKLAEINLVFNRAKMGEYGEMYGTPTLPKVMGWFKKYWKEREQTVLDIRYSENAQHKQYRESNESPVLAAVKGVFSGVRLAAENIKK